MKKALWILCLVALAQAWTSAETPSVQNRIGVSKVFGGASLVDRSMNPAISANALFLGAYGEAVPSAERGLQVQEIEAIFTASVDPYFFGNLSFSAEGGAGLAVEEAFVSTLSIPMVTLKIGKFLLNFGRNNWVHNHGQPLIDRPLVVRELVGEEGINSTGVESSWLIPTPWYFDLTLGILRAKDSGVFDTPDDDGNTSSPETLLVDARMEHLFDLTDTLTLSVGSSYVGGNNPLRKLSHLMGGDLTLKYVKGRGKGDFAFAWQNEVIQRIINTSSDTQVGFGAYSSFLLRFSPTLWAGVRLDYLKVQDASETLGENLLFAYIPSEFSAVRFQIGAQQKGGAFEPLFLVQYNMSIGSHPAHAY